MHPNLNIENPTLPFILIFVETSSYIAFITDAIHSYTPRYLSAHQITYSRTLSNPFSKSTKAIHRSVFTQEVIHIQTVASLGLVSPSVVNSWCHPSILPQWTLPNLPLLDHSKSSFTIPYRITYSNVCKNKFKS